jgi:segregation and condensation protein B
MSATKEIQEHDVVAESNGAEAHGNGNGNGHGNGNGNGAHGASDVTRNHTDGTDTPVVAQDNIAIEGRGSESADALLPVNETELKAILEALLFVSHEPLTTDRAVAVLGVSRAEAIQGFRQLQQQYDRDERGLQVVEVAGGFRLATRPDYAPWVKRLEKIKPAPKLSRSALETLAIIAYKQPIVRSEIEQIRGVETSGVLRTLLERKLTRMVGRKEVPGRPIMYGTTKFFLEHFGLRDLSELPPLREFKDLGDAEQLFVESGQALRIGSPEEPVEDVAVCQRGAESPEPVPAG